MILFSLSDEISKANGGSVEALKEHPSNPEKVFFSMFF